MAKASPPVRLQVLLRSDWRNEQGRSDVAATLRKLGLEVTGTGQASISARASSAVVTELFGAKPPVAKSAGQVGLTDAELSVPDALAERVQRITIAPQHVAMSDGTSSGDRARDKEKP